MHVSKGLAQSIDCLLYTSSKLNVTVRLEHLIRIIELETNTDIELRFADRMMLYVCGSISAGDMYVAQQEPREVE